MALDITGKAATDEDFKRIGDRLTNFTLQKGGPDYKPLSRLFQAAADGKIVGEMLATHLWGQVEVNLLEVHEDYRKQGIGGKLLSAAEDFARAHDARGIYLWTPTWQGEGFYEREGFAELARLPLNTDGHFDGKPQAQIFYYKPLS